MGKKQNVIEINGKRYDAHTGAPLNHGHQQITTPSIVKPAKPETKAEAKPAAKHHHASRAPHKAAKHADHHKPQRSATLMRRSVRKPGASLKRRLKVQGNTGALAEQPSAEIYRPPSFGTPDTKRLSRANHVRKSQLITHFNLDQPAYSGSAAKQITVKSQPAKPGATPKPVSRQPAPDIDDIFERAIQQATSHLQPTPKKPRKRRLHLTRKHSRA